MANENARWLRKNMIDAEKLLWKHLKSAQMGYSFRKQEPIGNGIIVDFVCYHRKLIVEADGGQLLNSESDKARDEWLQSQGFRILRFWNNDILKNTDGVLETIHRALREQ